MTNSQRLALVRAHLHAWIRAHLGDTAEADAPEHSEAIESESILIRDGFYAGRIFHADPFRATWFMEQDELKIQEADGSTLAVFVGDEITGEVEPPAPDTIPIKPASDGGDDSLPQAA